MSKTHEQHLQDSLANAADRELARSKRLSQTIYDLACAVRAKGMLELSLRDLAALADLGPWRSAVKDKLLPALRGAPMHPPLDGFVTSWEIRNDSVMLRWNVAAPGEAVH